MSTTIALHDSIIKISYNKICLHWRSCHCCQIKTIFLYLLLTLLQCVMCWVTLIQCCISAILTKIGSVLTQWPFFKHVTVTLLQKTYRNSSSQLSSDSQYMYKITPTIVRSLGLHRCLCSIKGMKTPPKCPKLSTFPMDTCSPCQDDRNAMCRLLLTVSGSFIPSLGSQTWSS